MLLRARDKLWVTDPNGIPWELYAGKGSIEVFGDDARPAASDACCAGEAGAPSSLSVRSETERSRSEGRSGCLPARAASHLTGRDAGAEAGAQSPPPATCALQ